MPLLRLGTRASRLALIQTEAGRARLAAAGLGDVQLVRISTTGDRLPNRSLAEAGGLGLFVKEIEQALLDERVDLAVHSAKDLPTRLPEGLSLVCCLTREDPRDVLVSAGGLKLEALEAGAVVGTGSMRRRAQLLARRRDLEVKEVRGNVETRLRKVREGALGAVVLAAAGLKRLGRAGEISEYLDFMLPAPGQGAIALEVRAGDAKSIEAARAICDPSTLDAITAERAFLRAVGGGCLLPVGALGRMGAEGLLTLEGCVADPDGRRILRESIEGPGTEGAELGETLARRLKDMGAEEILDALRGS